MIPVEGSSPFSPIPESQVSITSNPESIELKEGENIVAKITLKDGEIKANINNIFVAE